MEKPVIYPNGSNVDGKSGDNNSRHKIKYIYILLGVIGVILAALFLRYYPHNSRYSDWTAARKKCGNDPVIGLTDSSGGFGVVLDPPAKIAILPEDPAYKGEIFPAPLQSGRVTFFCTQQEAIVQGFKLNFINPPHVSVQGIGVTIYKVQSLINQHNVIDSISESISYDYGSGGQKDIAPYYKAQYMENNDEKSGYNVIEFKPSNGMQLCDIGLFAPHLATLIPYAKDVKWGSCAYVGTSKQGWAVYLGALNDPNYPQYVNFSLTDGTLVAVDRGILGDVKIENPISIFDSLVSYVPPKSASH